MSSSVSVTAVHMDVTYASFFDENLPPSSLTNSRGGQKSCALTTGGFPHELVLTTTAASAKVHRIVFRLNDAKHIVVERRNDDGSYTQLDERELDKEGGDVKEVDIVLDPATNGKDIHEIRLRILSGHSEFVGIYRVTVFGEESQQKFVVIEQKAEISM